ncbi:MAG: SPOR domain-containing protein [Gammaproteobacteria bacterium]|jgi:cell division protein FtsN|nr:SPOR domain-containing protein [Gammaproteobacteria bacterium]
MARDYARGKKPKKTTQPKASPWRSLFTLLIAGGFVGGLWFLAQQPKDQTAPPPKPQSATTTIKPKQSTEQADRDNGNNTSDDKSSFDFYNLLPESQIEPQEVAAYKSTPKDPNKKTNTLLQAGSFRKLKDAERLRAKLILLNLPNVVTEKTTSSSGSVWYRVRLGPFANRSKLNKAEDILAQNNIAPLRINRE